MDMDEVIAMGVVEQTEYFSQSEPAWQVPLAAKF